jgi:NAD(P)-dependent dehydrogenase (short-subunit alcohol dehydrogenase family)
MNNTILITGASSGIGNVTARYFQSKGWNVIATMRSPEKALDLATLENVLVTRLDVEDSDSIDQAIAAGIKAFGGIDVLLNNAGYGASGALEATPIEKIRRQFDTNVIGLLEVTKAALPHLRASNAGQLINISSPAGYAGFPLSALYCGSKFAVEGISEALAYELASVGVAVKLVIPGYMKTEFSGRSFDLNTDDNLVAYEPIVSRFEEVRHSYPAGADPVHVAEVIYKAATDKSKQLRYVAGADAEDLISKRHRLDDGIFMQGIREQFGIASD